VPILSSLYSILVCTNTQYLLKMSSLLILTTQKILKVSTLEYQWTPPFPRLHRSSLGVPCVPSYDPLVLGTDQVQFCNLAGHHFLLQTSRTSHHQRWHSYMSPCTGLPSMRSTTLLCRPRLRSSFHRAIRPSESNAAFRSTKAIQRGLWNSFLLWTIVFKVKIRSALTVPVWTHFAPLYGVPEIGHEPYSAEP